NSTTGLLDARRLERTAAAIEAEARNLLRLSCRRHQRGHVAPQIEAAEVPASSPDPRLGTLHVLDHQRDMPPCRLARLALDAEAGIEQRGQLLHIALATAVLGRLRLRLCPRHRHVAEFLAGRAGDDQV